MGRVDGGVCVSYRGAVCAQINPFVSVTQIAVYFSPYNGRSAPLVTPLCPIIILGCLTSKFISE